MHERWKTVKDVKEALDKYDDNCYVFIEPHKYMTDYPFYIFQDDNKIVYFRLYDETLLPEPLKMRIENFVQKWRQRWNLVNFRKKQ